MDQLQKPRRNDGKPIQNSAGSLGDLSRLIEIDENTISLHEGLNKVTEMPRHLPGTNKTLDPIARLPPELSTLFIQVALSSYSHSSRLIELTTISKRWQGFLCSTPVLWSELVIDETQEDFLATLSVFLALSRKAALRLTFLREPIDWTGLVSLLLPVAQRITTLMFEEYDYREITWISSVLSTVFGRLGYLPRLKEVDFDKFVWPGGSGFRTASSLLPSTVKLKGDFQITMPEGCQNSGTPTKFFDIIKYNTFATLEPGAPSSNSFNFRYTAWPFGVITIDSNDATLALLESLAGRLAELHCFEQAVYWTTRHLQYLSIRIHLSRVQDTIDCLRLLIRLRILDLHIQTEDSAKPLNWAPNNAACRDLRSLGVFFHGDEVPGNVISAERTIRNLFSAFQTLYPYVEELHIYGHTWPFFASSYLQSLQALRSLVLKFTDTKYNPVEGSINLQSLQCLFIAGPAYFDSLHMPNLLKLILELPDLDMWPTHLSHPHVRSLTIATDHIKHDSKVLSLDFTDLRDLRLYNIPLRATRELLSLSNVVSIKLASELLGMVDPPNNHLCIALLSSPTRLPSLQKLHFDKCIDWDVLLLMLQRRNIGQIGVKRIDTVTLPFIPFALQHHLACLLAAESLELPSLVSLSLEATRDVMFDSTVYVYILDMRRLTHGTQSPGCFACLHSMRPGCTARVFRRADPEWDMPPVDAIYPVEDSAVEVVPTEIRDWLSHRGDLVDLWRASYEEFSQDFSRQDICREFPRVQL